MNKMKQVLILILCISLVCCACNKKEDKGCTVDDVSSAVTLYLKQDYSMCTESLLATDYNNLNESSKAEVAQFLKFCSVTDVKETSGNVYSVTVKHPSIDKTLARATKDTGFVSDYNNAVLSNASNEDKAILIQQYLKSALGNNADDFVEDTVSVEMQENDEMNYLIKSDLTLYQLIKTVIECDLVGSVDSLLSQETVNASETVQESKSDVALKTVKSDKCFMFEQNNARLLVEKMSIQQDDEALQSMRQLSDINKNLSTNEKAYFIRYSVKNLSTSEVQVTDCFKMVASNGEILSTDGAHVSGVSSVANIPAGEEAELTSFLVGPSDASIVWYEDGIIGCYTIEIVQ